MTITPTGNLVLLKPLPNETISAGGIVIPQTAMEDVKSKAKVIAVGPGRRNKHGVLEPLDVKEGDTVILLRFHLDREKVTVDGEELSLVAEPDLWGVIEE